MNITNDIIYILNDTDVDCLILLAIGNTSIYHHGKTKSYMVRLSLTMFI